jgi:hypothetical protein
MFLSTCSWWGVFHTTLCDKVRQWLATGRWFSPGTLFSFTNKTDRYDITEILLKVTLNTINLNQTMFLSKFRKILLFLFLRDSQHLFTLFNSNIYCLKTNISLWQTNKQKLKTWHVYNICKLDRSTLYTIKPVLRGHLWDKEKVVF